MIPSRKRLEYILKMARRLCLTARTSPLASIIMSAREQFKPRWVSCLVRSPESTSQDARGYVSGGPGNWQICIVVPPTMADLSACRRICSTTALELAEILWKYGNIVQGHARDNGDADHFKQGFAVRAVSQRGFVASRARHTILGLEYVCSDIFAPRSKGLVDWVHVFLDGFLWLQDHEQ